MVSGVLGGGEVGAQNYVPSAVPLLPRSQAVGVSVDDFAADIRHCQCLMKLLGKICV